MDYSKIIAVSGLQGLHELISSKNDGAIVRSLDDKSTKFVSSRIHNFSHLESIEVFTTKDNTNLADIFRTIKASTEKMPEEKADGKELKAYFEKVYPDLDFDRVYASDMKKMIRWFNILTRSEIDFESAGKDENGEITNEVKPEKKANVPLKEGKPVKSTVRKIESRGVK